MNELFWQLLRLCPLVFLAGMIDSIAGGGGLITLPAYLAVGLPPHLAIGTNKCSSTFGTLVSTLRFMKGKRVHLMSAASAAVAALIGSPIGAMLNLYLDEIYLQYVLLVAIPCIAMFLLFNRNMGAYDTSNHWSSHQILLCSFFIGLVIGMYDGFLGPGTGSFLILAFTVLLGFDIVTASGNAKVVNLSSNIAALITFTMHDNIVWRLGVPALFFGVLGNWIGSGLALKQGNKVIRPIFFAVMVLLLLKVMTDTFF